MRKLIWLLVLGIWLSGCATVKHPTYEEYLREAGLENVKQDLNGMNEEDIRRYFDECISNHYIFIYTGGYANAPLVAPDDFEFVKGMKQVSLGCTGGVPEGSKFNALMLEFRRNTDKVRDYFNEAYKETGRYPKDNLELISDKEWEGAKSYLIMNLDKQTFEDINKLRKEKGENWYIEYHLPFGMQIRNLLRDGGFNWGNWGLDDNWGILLNEALVKVGKT